MATLSVVLRKQKGRSKGNVFIQYVHQEKPTIFSCNVSVTSVAFEKKTRSWIKKNEVGHQGMNRRISEKLREIDEAINLLGGSPTVYELKSFITQRGEDSRSVQATFTDQYELYIQNLADIRKSTAAAKRGAMKHWKGFIAKKKKEIQLSDLSIKLFDQFVEYLKQQRLSASTRGRVIKDIKACIKWLHERGTINDELYTTIKLPRWKVAKQKPRNIDYLHFDELRKVMSYEPTTERLQRVKDLFVLQCNLGTRVSDLQRIKKEGSMIRMRAKKTDELIELPINSLAREILDKYDDRPPFISDQKYNDYIKELLEKAGIDRKIDIPAYRYNRLPAKRKQAIVSWQKAQGYHLTKEAREHAEQLPAPLFAIGSSHICVRTFISLAAEAGITPKTIATLTGKSVKVILESYLGTSKETLIREMDIFDNALRTAQ